ncbi:MAG: type II secretion system protein N [Pseudomonadota bacterium]|nr:type II secretion system protein N [Pseudomonadota bacterium]
MPRSLTLALVFLVSLLVFLIIGMPAAAVVEQVPALRPGGAALTLSDPRGRWWQGQARWRWKQLQGSLDWELDWHGLVPGANLSLRSDRGESARLSGWLGADWGDWQLEQARLSLPVAMVAEHVPQGSADGRLDGVLMALTIADDRIAHLQGTLDYSGGQVTWGNNGSATVPALRGRLSMEEDAPTLRVVDPEGERLMHARIAEGRFHLEVMRAWPLLLGVSQGGSPEDVVFQMSQPFSLKQG